MRVSKDAIAALALSVLAWLLRAYAAMRFASEPVWDAHYYDYYARRIAEGFGYSDGAGIGMPSHPAAHYPVGFSGFLSAFYAVFGSTHGVAIAVSVGLGTSVVALSYGLARSYAPRAVAVTAALMVACHPGLILYSTLIMSEQLACALALLALYVRVRNGARAEASHWRFVPYLVLGLATLVRPQSLLLFPALLPWPNVWTRSAWGTMATATVLGAMVTMAPVLPWTARNCMQMDGCVLVSSNGGWNLAIGSFPRATGRFETLHGTDGCTVVTGQVQQDRCWGQLGAEWIRNDTARWLRLIPEKLHQTFDHESFAVNYLKQGRPELWPDAQANLWRERISGVHVGLMALATAGTLVAVLRTRLTRRGRPMPYALWGILFYIAGVVVTHAVFFGEDRYHIVVVPAFCILAAELLGLGALLGRRSQSDRVSPAASA